MDYYSFKEFEENYTRDLNLFTDKYPNAREIDFLKEIKRSCLLWTKDENGLSVFNDKILIIYYSYSQYDGVTSEERIISLDWFAHIINYNFKHYLPSVENPFDFFTLNPFDDNDDDIAFYPVEKLFSLIEEARKKPDYFHASSNFNRIHKQYYLTKTYHLEYFHFLYYENGKVKADNEKFKDFGFAVFKIMDEVDRKIKLFELQKNNIFPVNENINGNTKQDFQEEPKPEPELKSNFSVPEKIALLEHLGIFARLVKDGVSPENEYKIIHSLIGGSYTNIKKYCLNRKNNNKSSKDYQITEKHRNTIRNFYNSKTY